jgi:hypothetical protein
VLDPHFVGDAGFEQAHEFGERRVRPARAAGQRRDQARDRTVAVSVERAQVNVSRGAAGRAIQQGLSPRAALEAEKGWSRVDQCRVRTRVDGRLLGTRGGR